MNSAARHLGTSEVGATRVTTDIRLTPSLMPTLLACLWRVRFFFYTGCRCVALVCGAVRRRISIGRALPFALRCIAVPCVLWICYIICLSVYACAYLNCARRQSIDRSINQSIISLIKGCQTATEQQRNRQSSDTVYDGSEFMMSFHFYLLLIE